MKQLWNRFKQWASTERLGVNTIYIPECECKCHDHDNYEYGGPR